ncbi:MAG: F0F1 ATP synthase subunit delta [Patescibacteria group bacterium]|nr:F0F1 ATP synthase subunit delta [Patescibacteria group bacterium]
MSFEIFDNLRTTDDALEIEKELLLLKESAYKQKGEGFLEVLQTRVKKSTCDFILSFLSNKFDDSDFIASKIEEIISKLKSIPVIIIKIGFEPSHSQITKISDFLCKTVGRKVLIDLFFDPQIISGAEIIKDGKYYDGTTNKKFYDSLLAQTKTVPREGDFLIGRLK